MEPVSLIQPEFDLPSNFVEFLNRSYPVIKEKMDDPSVCDKWFAQHCQHNALTKALCINEIRWVLVDYVPATREAFVIASSQAVLGGAGVGFAGTSDLRQALALMGTKDSVVDLSILELRQSWSRRLASLIWSLFPSVASMRPTGL